MKYVLMMHVRGQKPYESESWPAEAWAAHVAFLTALNDDLRASNELVAILGLESPDKATRVRAVTGGAPVTDGVFPEAKEFLAGYWLIDVPSLERAHAIAARASEAPGPAGTPLNTEIEVRGVL